ncbi:MAG: hypothetical protein RLZ62_808 [Bacteroidota bacterium]|jgi:glycosyltransferase involved in cell wall biosynthesis
MAISHTKDANPVSFSIVTVVFNGENLLRDTIESVRAQSWTNIEYIIVDGASADGTLSIVREFADKMPNLKWISEKDSGLYDAMNKGLRMATGDFIQFLNCGDCLHDQNTIASVARCVSADTDVVYGDTLLVDDTRQPAGLMSELSTRKLPTRLHWKKYLGGMLVVHQSFIPRRTIAPDYIQDNLCADYDWCIRILKNSRNAVNTGIVITDYLMGGMSKKRHRQSLLDRFSVMKKHFGLARTLAAHAWIVIRAAIHRIFRTGKARY